MIWCLVKYGLCHYDKNFWIQSLKTYIKYLFQVSVVLPDTESVPADLSGEFTNKADYYKVKNFLICEFIDKQFVDLYSSELVMWQIWVYKEHKLIAIIHSRHLLFSLCRETYHTLGIEGKPSAFCGKHSEWYFLDSNIMLKDEITTRTFTQRKNMQW